MTTNLPIHFHPELSADRLQLVANWLLEELYATEDDLSRETDDGYTRGCTVFGRQKNRVKSHALSGRYDWLKLSNGGNDLVFTIGGIPCRFSTDDPENPTKEAVTQANRYQLPFLEFVDKGEPGKFCFVVDRGQNDDQDPCVEFLGFSPDGAVVCRWVSESVRLLHDTSTELVPAATIAKPVVAPKRPEVEDDQRPNVDTAP